MEGRWEAKGEKETDELGEERGNNVVEEKEGKRMTGKKREKVEEERKYILKRGRRGRKWEEREREEKGDHKQVTVTGEEAIQRMERKEQTCRGRRKKWEEREEGEMIEEV